MSGILSRHRVADRPILLAFSPKSGKLRQIDLSKAPVTPLQRRQLDPVGRSGPDGVLGRRTLVKPGRTLQPDH